MGATSLMDTFKQFLKSTKGASAILPEDAIAALIAADDTKALWAYAYRLAGAVAAYMRARYPESVDDTDWQDAVQDCAATFPSILAQFKRAGAKNFNAYMARAFQNSIIDSLKINSLGGTGSARTIAQSVVSYGDRDGGASNDGENMDDMFDQYGPNYDAESTAFGTRDPLVELLAEETATLAVKHRTKHPKAGRPWW